jgi:Na+/H+ antiporter NhaD/arsenite permease-like protein
MERVTDVPWPFLPLLSRVAWAAEAAPGSLAENLPAVSVVPFVGLLLSLGLFPILVPSFWERPRNQLLVAAIWAAPTLFYLGTLAALSPQGSEALLHLWQAGNDYVSFVVLLGTLFVIAGGIHIETDLEGRPLTNTLFLAGGSILASIIGTTGASMLLVRPLLRTNRDRNNVRHIPIFFVFLVANIGGLLTPLGDPPLLLGYLRGVPFLWPLEHLGMIWVFLVGSLLALFFLIDVVCYRSEDLRPRDSRERLAPVSFKGAMNVLLLTGVVMTLVFLPPDPAHPLVDAFHLRELALLSLGALSWIVTPNSIRAENRFHWRPILEVAAVFFGIFVTMIPPVLLLEAHGPQAVHDPLTFFWVTGLFSSILDNAPTYVAFAAAACGHVPECIEAGHLGALAASPEGAPLLAAVSAGSVVMGALTYIGNGPNLLVKAVARDHGYGMPSFFGYVAWAAVILLPLFAVAGWIFFR